MKAVVVTKPGGPEVLQMSEVETPSVQSDEIRVAVKATAVNRLDLMQRMGKYPAPADCPQDILGVEYAGVVDQIGANVRHWQPGDRVFGLVGGGSYAQFIVTHHKTAMRMPDNLSFEEAAAIPEAFITAYDAIILQCGLKEGETILINAAGSGVGVAAIQIANLFKAKSIGTARSSYKIESAYKLGLHEGIVVNDNIFAQQVLNLTGGSGVDVVLELVGGNYLSEDLCCVAPKARIIVVGLVAGASTQLDLGALLRKRLTIRGTVLRARPLAEKIAITEEFTNKLLPCFSSGKLRPVIDQVMPLQEVAEAHKLVAKNETFAKVVLRVD